MGHQPAGVTFAAIGHLDTWDRASRFVNSLRVTHHHAQLPIATIKSVFGFIPPRKLFEVEVISPVTGKVKGMYIESFISPDELDAAHLHANLRKVREACCCAEREGAAVASLGGFTSIVLEAGREEASVTGRTQFTTGNTLTAGFIVKAVESVCRQRGKALQAATLLIVGSTGDIGSACARYFENSVKSLLLCARQAGPLARQSQEFIDRGISARYAVHVNELLPSADIVICVASSIMSDADFGLLPHDAIICDAGYPKNLAIRQPLNGRVLFAGGMGMVRGGYTFFPDHRSDIYDFPGENVMHGCFLEGIVLAMEGKPVAFSRGRGKITVSAINDIVGLAAKHGVEPAIH